MKIFYQYSKSKTLPLVKGDFINEYYNCSVLNQFNEVYYSGQRFPDHLQQYKHDVVDSVTNDYDAYIIRANENVFNKIDNSRLKMLVASPVNPSLFSVADYLITYTNAWQSDLNNGVVSELNPTGTKFNNVITFNQAYGDHFKPLQTDELTKKIKAEINGDIIIGMFGRIVPNSYPHLLIDMWPTLLKKYGNIKLIVGYTVGEFPDLPNVIRCKIDHHLLPYYISACDCTIITEHCPSWNIAGCRRVKESAACNVPIILSESDARCEELGKEYPYFLPKNIFDCNITTERRELFLNTLDQILNNKSNQLKLVENIQKYSILNCSLKLQQVFNETVNIHYKFQ